MSWIAPVAMGIAGMFGQNAQNKAADKNNTNQQATNQAATSQANAAAQQQMAPWLAQGGTPFAGASAGPRPGGPTQGAGVAQQVMGAANPMGAAPGAAPAAPGAAPPGGPPPGGGQMHPQLLALIQHIMQSQGGGMPPQGAPPPGPTAAPPGPGAG